MGLADSSRTRLSSGGGDDAGTVALSKHVVAISVDALRLQRERSRKKSPVPSHTASAGKTDPSSNMDRCSQPTAKIFLRLSYRQHHTEGIRGLEKDSRREAILREII
jgi:hypothetical protein